MSYIAASVFSLVLFFILLFTHASRYNIPTQDMTLEFRAKTSAPIRGMLFHDIRNEGRLYEEDVTAFELTPANDYQLLRFKLPRLPIRFLRIDLTSKPGDFFLRDIRLLDGQGRVIREIPPTALESLNPTTVLMVTGDEASIRRSGTEEMSFLWVNIPYPVNPPLNPYAVTGFSIALIWILFGVAVLFGTRIAARALQNRYAHATSFPGPSDPWPAAGVMLAALFLVMLGSRWLLIQNFGVSLPHWDAWETEGWDLFAPFKQGNLSWEAMFEKTNEHRVFFARVLSLGLLMLGKQWDAHVGMLINALIYSATGLGLCLIVWKLAGRRYLGWIGLLFLLSFAAPHAWENTIWASQSAFYTLFLLSVVSIWLLGMHPAFSSRWWIGLTFSLCAVFTMSSGMLAAVTVVGLSVLRMVRCRRMWRSYAPTLVAAGLIAALGRYYAVTEKAHAGWASRNIGDFFLSLGRTGAWPWIDAPLLMPLVWIPLALLLVYYFLTRDDDVRLTEWLLGLGIWSAAQVAAIALFRGAGGGAPESRHMDSMSLGLVVNGLAMLVLLSKSPQLRLPRRSLATGGRRLGIPPMVWRAFTMIWLVVAITGTTRLSIHVLSRDVPNRKASDERCVDLVARFLKNDNIQMLMSSPVEPYVRWVMPAFLRNEHIRAIMPASVKNPLTVTAARTDNNIFQAGALDPEVPQKPGPVWGSYPVGGPQRALGVFISQPIAPPSWPFLEFDIAGELGDPGLILQLHDITTGKVTPVRPAPGLPKEWRRVTVRAPRHPFVIEAQDARPDRWFAFTAPREKSNLAGWSDQCLAASPLVFGGGLALMAVSGLLVLFRRMRDPAPATSITGPYKTDLAPENRKKRCS